MNDFPINFTDIYYCQFMKFSFLFFIGLVIEIVFSKSSMILIIRLVFPRRYRRNCVERIESWRNGYDSFSWVQKSCSLESPWYLWRHSD